MYIANEGRLVAFGRAGRRRRRPRRVRSVPAASGRAEIASVGADPPGMVLVETSFGGRRVMDQLVGDPLPRSVNDSLRGGSNGDGS